jgi:drug/metabolite transporter (DMT)-like permease
LAPDNIGINFAEATKFVIVITETVKKVNQTRFFIGVAILIIANVGFSSKAVLIKLMYQYQVDTVSVITLRMLLSVPFFILTALWLASRENNVKLTKQDWLKISGLGILSYYVSSMLDFLGLQYLSAALERLILFTYPTMVLILSAIFLKKKITPPQYLALILTYIGIAVIFLFDTGLGAQKNLWLGATLIFICAFTYSIYVIGTGEIVHRIGSVKFSCYSMLAATVPVLIQSLFYNGMDIFHFQKEVYVLSAWLVIIATVIPIFLIVEGIRLVGSGNSSIIGFVGPVSTIFLGHIFLGEAITPVQLLGTAIVLAGVFLISWKR